MEYQQLYVALTFITISLIHTLECPYMSRVHSKGNQGEFDTVPTQKRLVLSEEN